jgi:hypothetical protein
MGSDQNRIEATNHLAKVFGVEQGVLKTACSAQAGVLYTQLAKFAALAVQGGA